MTTIARAHESFEPLNLLGRRLRERRRELGLTLAEVAAAAGISVGHSSSIEKGTTLPSLPVLARVAHALDLTLAEVLRASPAAGIARGKVDASLDWAQLVGAGSRVQVWYVRERSGVSASAPFPLAGDDLFVFVHVGEIEIDVNDVRHVLSEGDSIHCQGPRSIAWTATSAGDAATLWVSRGARARDRL
ncbi:MAG TPA: XRE family transcriptional regulator [Gaiellaceae bacterium]|nr:XRE family transcriptional regulator [Gaiellaceae bacterium]